MWNCQKNAVNAQKLRKKIASKLNIDTDNTNKEIFILPIKQQQKGREKEGEKRNNKVQKKRQLINNQRKKETIQGEK